MGLRGFLLVVSFAAGVAAAVALTGSPGARSAAPRAAEAPAGAEVAVCRRGQRKAGRRCRRAAAESTATRLRTGTGVDEEQMTEEETEPVESAPATTATRSGRREARRVTSTATTVGTTARAATTATTARATSTATAVEPTIRASTTTTVTTTTAPAPRATTADGAATTRRTRTAGTGAATTPAPAAAEDTTVSQPAATEPVSVAPADTEPAVAPLESSPTGARPRASAPATPIAKGTGSRGGGPASEDSAPSVPRAPSDSAHGRPARAPVTLAFRLETPARVTFGISRAARACRLLGTFSVQGHRALNRVRFTGSLAGKRLAPGRYLVSRRGAIVAVVAVTRDGVRRVAARAGRRLDRCTGPRSSGEPAQGGGYVAGDVDRTAPGPASSGGEDASTTSSAHRASPEPAGAQADGSSAGSASGAEPIARRTAGAPRDTSAGARLRRAVGRAPIAIVSSPPSALALLLSLLGLAALLFALAADTRRAQPRGQLALVVARNRLGVAAIGLAALSLAGVLTMAEWLLG